MRSTALPLTLVRDPAALALYLAERRMPGQRSKTAITLLRRERRRRTSPQPALPPLADRARARRWASIMDEISRRGGETEIVGNFGTTYLEIADRHDGMVLLHAEGWRSYGRQPARTVRLSYLWGPDDAGSGPWAVRIPGTVTTVTDAVDWLTPAAVKNAQARGLRVRRQGDVYAVETTRAHDGHGSELLPASHEWRPTRFLVHKPEDGRRHRPLRLPWPVRFVRQSAYEMGRTNTRGDAD